MASTEKEDILKDIWRLNKKADQMRSFNGEVLDRLRYWNNVSTGYVTIGSALGTTAIFADIPDSYFLLWGGVSASVFIVSLLPTAFNVSKLIEERVKSLNLYTSWIREAQNFGNLEINSMTDSEARVRQKELNESYRNIAIQTIPINNKDFNKMKQRHLQKIAISKELDQNPFESISSIRKRLKESKNSN